MTDETKQLIGLQLSVLKQTMKEDGVIFGFAVDKSDVNKSMLCFMDKEKYLKNGKNNGFSVDLTELNRDLL